MTAACRRNGVNGGPPNARHQRSPEGRLDHRDHQRAYRARCRLRRVTDTPSITRRPSATIAPPIEAPGHPARLRRVRARVGRAAPAETAIAVTTEADQATVTRGTAATRAVAEGGTGR